MITDCKAKCSPTPEDAGSKPLKYPRPKILLVDMEQGTDLLLREEGYNVSIGSFGIPYKVEKNDSLAPVILNGYLPLNLTEQQIVIINLMTTSMLGQAQGEKETTNFENDWWTKQSNGYIDPRPRLMESVRNQFDIISLHGGIFIIFAAEMLPQKVFVGFFRYGFEESDKFTTHNWSFLTILNHLSVKANYGEEISVVDSPLAGVLSDHLKEAKFRCSISTYPEGPRGPKIVWTPLCRNKFGETVGGIFQSRILIFPQLEVKLQFIVKLLKENLPELYPCLFPYAEGTLWTQKLEYEHPKVLELKAKIEEVHEEARRQVNALEQGIEKERAAMRFLHDLITGTDKVLVKAVKKTLEILGFKEVIDVDEEMEKAGDKGQKGEDLQIHDYSPTLLAEVKGIAGLPKDAAALQSWKYLAPRMKEWSRTDIQALSIINHQKNLPGLDRENENPFREDIITNAKEHGFGLLTTWDLFRLTRGYLSNGWGHEHIKPIFYKHGRIDPVPEHYEFLGEVEEFWEKVSAVGVRLTAATLNLGDRISFECPVEFKEQKVESLQVENKPVNLAEVGNLAGIHTHFSKKHLRKGVRIFRVTG
jgi:hypothetical protein